MLDWLWRKPKPKPEPEPEAVVVEGFSGRKLRDMPQGKLGAIIITNHCPDCGGQGFFAGPSGGMATNIYCRNPQCRSAFNFTSMFGEGFAERIGKAPDDVYE
jgi:hypothetical protein